MRIYPKALLTLPILFSFVYCPPAYSQTANLTFQKVFSLPAHEDFIQIAIASNNDVLVSWDSVSNNLGGIYFSTDSGSTWHESIPETNPTIGPMAGNENGVWYYGGQFWGLFRSTDHGTSWARVDSNWYEGPSAIAVEGSDTVIAAVPAVGIYLSKDGGVSWDSANVGLLPDEDSTGRFFGGRGIGTISISPQGYIFAGSGIYYGGGCGVARSTDNGATWHYTNSGLLDSTVAQLAISRNGWIVAACDGQPSSAYIDSIPHIFLSTNAGENWHPITKGADYSKYADDYAAIFGRVIVATFNYDLQVSFSTDTGATWHKVGLNGFPAIDSSGFLYVASFDGSVYKSTEPLNVLTSVQSLTISPPSSFALLQNFPNPFNPSTTITYRLPTSAYVSVRVFDVLGREVTTITQGRESAGQHSVIFDAAALPSGVYFYELQAGSYHDVKKLLLLK